MNLLLGDSTELLATLPDNSIDLTVTSPPYDNLRTYNGSLTDWTQDKWQAIIAELYRVTKQGGVVVWVVGDATINGSETGTSFRQALWAMECGFRLHDTMIWNKGGFTAVGALRTRYGPVFEFMFVWTKNAPAAFSPLKDRRNKQVGAVRYSTVRQKDGTTKPASSTGSVTREFGQRFNVWEMPPEQSSKNRLHPAPFPEALARDHILSWSNEGDTVLDPFLGSGTTGKMAVQLNRKFIGIERDAEYFQIAQRRIAEAAVQERMAV